MENSLRMTQLQAMAKLMTTDSDLWVVPRFQELHLINILALQQQLSVLEDRFEARIACEARHNSPQPCSLPGCVKGDVLQEIQRTIKAYDDAILAFSAIGKTKRPAEHVFDGLEEEGHQWNMPDLHKMLDCRGKGEVLSKRNDTSHLLSIANMPRTWFHRFVEKHDRLGKLFETKSTEGRGGKKFRKFPEKKLRNFELGIVATCLCLVQLLPVLALTLVASQAAKLAIIIVLILLVSLLNALFANTVQATNFGAVAAYSAIVVAFVSQNK